jgi:hypothetical protein
MVCQTATRWNSGGSTAALTCIKGRLPQTSRLHNESDADMRMTLDILLAIHVLSLVWWIGGVATVTASLLPLFGRLPAEQRIWWIQRFEGRFANQARVAVLLAGISGFWMYALLPGAITHTWWIGLMLLVWVLFAIMLFMAEPLRLPARLGLIQDPRKFLMVHAVLLVLALVAIAGGVIGARGGF